MRRSPIGSITCSIKGPFVRASAARGGDIYLSQTFYSAANLHQKVCFFVEKLLRDFCIPDIVLHSKPSILNFSEIKKKIRENL